MRSSSGATRSAADVPRAPRHNRFGVSSGRQERAMTNMPRQCVSNQKGETTDEAAD
jgi:hypothetical protein